MPTEHEGGGWMNDDQRDACRSESKAIISSVDEVCRVVRVRLPKWKVWFPDENSIVDVPRRDLLALVVAAEHRSVLLSALEDLASAAAEAWGEDRPCVRVALKAISTVREAE